VCIDVHTYHLCIFAVCASCRGGNSMNAKSNQCTPGHVSHLSVRVFANTSGILRPRVHMFVIDALLQSNVVAIHTYVRSTVLRKPSVFKDIVDQRMAVKSWEGRPCLGRLYAPRSFIRVGTRLVQYTPPPPRRSTCKCEESEAPRTSGSRLPPDC
jgi:hypothetical protein